MDFNVLFWLYREVGFFFGRGGGAGLKLVGGWEGNDEATIFVSNIYRSFFFN